MRYLIAILFSVIGAVLAIMFLSGPAANWVALQFSYESSDDAETVNQVAFIAVNMLGLIVGWVVGWALGGWLERPQKPI
ncbi:MAG TPA: hypothetical protein VNK52_06650 [Hyphomicrobiaceae bacterium]|nr:hypothetical protein [Hyphomicrobiaceae bacterium]